jgi:hypothetical protein
MNENTRAKEPIMTKERYEGPKTGAGRPLARTAVLLRWIRNTCMNKAHQKDIALLAFPKLVGQEQRSAQAKVSDVERGVRAPRVDDWVYLGIAEWICREYLPIEYKAPRQRHPDVAPGMTITAEQYKLWLKQDAEERAIWESEGKAGLHGSVDKTYDPVIDPNPPQGFKVSSMESATYVVEGSYWMRPATDTRVACVRQVVAYDASLDKVRFTPDVNQKTTRAGWTNAASVLEKYLRLPDDYAPPQPEPEPAPEPEPLELKLDDKVSRLHPLWGRQGANADGTPTTEWSVLSDEELRKRVREANADDFAELKADMEALRATVQAYASNNTRDFHKVQAVLGEVLARIDAMEACVLKEQKELREELDLVVGVLRTMSERLLHVEMHLTARNSKVVG